MADFAIFGTPLEELDEEDKDVVSRRPLGVHEQTVRDDRGRRRFHGAFTGGFSAGYFNTVGSKEGWQPKQFRSSRDERFEKTESTAEDFMDEEDFSEFGIASRRIRPVLEGGSGSQNRHAWERGPAASTSLAAALEAIVLPVSDSMGSQLLKKMGWREGRGIGPKLSRKVAERRKQDEARAHGAVSHFDDEAVREADEMAAGFEFEQEDVISQALVPRRGLHGLGYEGLRESAVLSDKYGVRETAYKTNAKSKGIRGQAFGVGAFEDDDANIYTSYDLSQYDFAIGGNDAPSTSRARSNEQADGFVLAEKRQRARTFFEPPRLPSQFTARHTPVAFNVDTLPQTLKKVGEQMTPAQRATMLGEVDKNIILELIRDDDRKRLARSREKEGESAREFNENLFEDEPMKQDRFKQFLKYLKRGLSFPQPVEMTSLEWERELADFHRVLPPHLRSLLPEVKSRQEPLARADLALPIAHVLQSKFISSTGFAEKRREVKDEDRLAAVRAKMFGELTRRTHEWHPSKQLAKRFNVPDPFPSSLIVGVPYLQKSAKTETLFNLGSFGGTALELQLRSERAKKGTVEASASNQAEVQNKESESDNAVSTNETQVSKGLFAEKAPEELLRAIFGASDESSSSSESENEEDATTAKGETSAVVETKNEPPKPPMKFITVMDLPMSPSSDTEEFGPKPPPPSSEPSLPIYSTIRRFRSEQEKKKEKKRHREERKKEEKEKKKSHHRKKKDKEKHSKR